MSRQQWHQWFASGTQTSGPTDAELWYLRSYAADQQQPLTRQEVFLRIDWTDALISHLEMSAFAFVNLYDGSRLAQLAASYDVSDRWSMGAYVSANLGGPEANADRFPSRQVPPSK